MLKLPAIVISRIFLLFAALSLAACGGGSSGGSDPAPDVGNDPETVSGDEPSGGGSTPAPDVGSDPGTVATAVKPGIFLTTITYSSGKIGSGALTLISRTGASGEPGRYAILPNAPEGTFGTLTFGSDGTFSDDGNGISISYDGDWQSSPSSLEGEVTSSGPLDATLITDTNKPDVSADIELTRAQTSDLGVTIEELDDRMYFMDDEFKTFVSIESDGTIDGGDNTGCTFFESKINIPNSDFNIFEGDIDLRNCGNVDGALGAVRDGKYPVVGFLRPSTQEGREKDLIFAGTNGAVIFLFIGRPN